MVVTKHIRMSVISSAFYIYFHFAVDDAFNYVVEDSAEKDVSLSSNTKQNHSDRIFNKRTTPCVIYDFSFLGTKHKVSLTFAYLKQKMFILCGQSAKKHWVIGLKVELMLQGSNLHWHEALLREGTKF